jgi:glycosyltransferase involved in cell wall biosynthesis
MALFEKGLVSIIIPVFNREKLLSETLDSVLNQTYTKWECIIVDDGSKDSSLNVAKEYARNDHRFKIYSRPWYRKKGANTCRNFGFELSKGEFIQWFDSDDLMEKEMIGTKIYSLLSNNTQIVISGASFFSKGLPKTFKELDLEPTTNNPAFEYISGNYWFGTPQAMFKRELILRQTKIFNEKLLRNQETEFYVRLLLGNESVSYVKLYLLSIRLHDYSISSSYLNMNDSTKMLFDIPAYLSLFLAFKNKSNLSPDIHKYFSDYFLRCLKKMNYKTFSYWRLFFLGNIHSLFPSFFFSSKIVLYRVFKNV